MLWVIIASAVIVPALAVAAFLIIRGRRSGGPISVVMLRSTARRISEADVRSAFRRVHRRDPQIQKIPFDPTTDGWLLIDEDLPAIAIIDSRRMYADKADMENAARKHEHAVPRNALINHTAWVSVDAMGVNASISKEARAKVYSLLAPIAAELLDDQCMLLYLPAEDRIAEPGTQSEAMLREGRIAELFSDDDLHAPLFQTSKEDEHINRAMDEARARLPEFCAAWERLGAKTKGMVKGRFPTGDASESEFIWVSVRSMTDAGFEGTIENNPVAPNIPKKGATVTVPLEDVVDWAYLDEQEKPHGLFVDRILMARQR